MSKKKGLSADEKRNRMLELFYEKKEVFQLKELEKIGPKEKGIVSQSVKDVVQSLVDDGLVDTEKIGTSVYFWAFPSKAANIRRTKLADMGSQLETTTKKLLSTEEQIAKAKIGKEQTDNREKLLDELQKAEEENKRVQQEIQKYKDCDPEVLESMKKLTDTAINAANRWTDNISATKAWCKKKFTVDEKDLNKQFQIPDDLDYID